ncbi:unnamed protein product [Calicophoron daubneyi]|uniref:Uncharacterized protein n=1 Tax=Calicophoron daubneyi TaxID=300641 RepID=A0AAV2T477_CALDB
MHFIGESGKSTKELEVIIARLKKVLQRALAENERLKCASGLVSREEMHKLQTENAELRSELEQARMAAGARLSEHRLNTEKSMTRLSHEYEQLRRSYEEMTAGYDKTKDELRKAQETISQLIPKNQDQ